MPISKYFGGSGEKVMSNMKKQYGSKKGESVFYATANKRGQKPEKKATGGYVGSPVASGGAGYAGGGVVGQNGQMSNRKSPRAQRKQESTPGRYAQAAPTGKGGFKVNPGFMR